MAGIYPVVGVVPGIATNAVDANTVNCANEIFYATNLCRGQFDPAAANAILSEILNFVNCVNLDYDCSILNNMCLALLKVSGVRNAVAGLDVPNGVIVSSTDGDEYWNCTGAEVTLAAGTISNAGLEGIGFCAFHNPSVQDAATGLVVPIGEFVDSSDNRLFWNGTGAITTLTGAQLTSTALLALGFRSTELRHTDAGVQPASSASLPGDTWHDTSTGLIYKYIDDGAGNSAWVQIS